MENYKIHIMKNYFNHLRLNCSFKQQLNVGGELYKLSLYVWFHCPLYDKNSLAFEYCFYIKKKDDCGWITVINTEMELYDFQGNKKYICIEHDSIDSEFSIEDRYDKIKVMFTSPEYFVPITFIKEIWFKNIGL